MNILLLEIYYSWHWVHDFNSLNLSDEDTFSIIAMKNILYGVRIHFQEN